VIPRDGHSCPPEAAGGQTTTETILLFPVFMLLVLGLIQMGQLATALLIANYAASSIARQVVRDGRAGDRTAHEARLRKLMTAGMKNGKVTIDMPTGGLMSNVTVNACAEIGAFPFVNYFVKHSIKLTMGPYISPTGGVNCESTIPNSMGPFYYYRQHPYYFVVHGKATARLNYQP